MNENKKNQAPLSFTLLNKEEKPAPAIHIIEGEDEPNELTLTLKNNTGSLIVLKGGEPVEQGKLTKDGPSTFYVYFNRMLSEENIRRIQVTPKVMRVPYFEETDYVSLMLEDQQALKNFTFKATINFSQLGSSEQEIFYFLDEQRKKGFSVSFKDDESKFVIIQEPLDERREVLQTFVSNEVLKSYKYYDVFIGLKPDNEEYYLVVNDKENNKFIVEKKGYYNKSKTFRGNYNKLIIGNKWDNKLIIGNKWGTFDNASQTKKLNGFRGEIIELFFWDNFIESSKILTNSELEKHKAYFKTFDTSKNGPISININIQDTKLSFKEVLPHWDVEAFTGKFGTYLALTPTADIVLHNSLSFSLKKINAEPQAKTSYVSIDYRNIPDVPDGTMQSELFVFKLPSNQLLELSKKHLDQATDELKKIIPEKVNEGIKNQKDEFNGILEHIKNVETEDIKAIGEVIASQKKLIKPPILCGFIHTNRIYVGQGKTNKLVLYLTNASKDTPLQERKPKDGKAGVPNSRFIISFVCSEDESDVGALATKNDISMVEISSKQEYGNKWKEIQLDKLNSDNVFWNIKPQNSSSILGTGKTATLELLITNIPASTEGITLMYIEYKDIEGYDGGCLTLPIEKVKPVEINKFDVKEENLPKVTLEYEVSNATNITCSPPRENLQQPNPVGSKSSGKIEFVIDQTTTFKLTARNEKTGQEVSKEVTVDYPQPPLGTIMMWHGEKQNIPKGWALCDGTSYKSANGEENLTTPNLRGRFVLGSGDPELKNKIDGKKTIKLEEDQLPSHRHPIHDQEHSHEVFQYRLSWVNSDARVEYTGHGGGYEHVERSHLISEGTHTGITKTEPIGKGKEILIMPPYYQLAYIMRVGDYEPIHK